MNTDCVSCTRQLSATLCHLHNAAARMLNRSTSAYQLRREKELPPSRMRFEVVPNPILELHALANADLFAESYSSNAAQLVHLRREHLFIRSPEIATDTLCEFGVTTTSPKDEGRNATSALFFTPLGLPFTIVRTLRGLASMLPLVRVPRGLL